MIKDELVDKLTHFYQYFCDLHNCKDTEFTDGWDKFINDEGNKFPHLAAECDEYVIELRPVFSNFELDIWNKNTRALYVVTFSNARYDKEKEEFCWDIDDWRISQFRVDGVEGDIDREIHVLQCWIAQIYSLQRVCCGV